MTSHNLMCDVMHAYSPNIKKKKGTLLFAGTLLRQKAKLTRCPHS
uniref:Uncharacterized protein n=1 Tax=Anguilla anguilla TaxID=7936 RepID=A0A0E9W0Y7_ANGAN